MSEPVERVEVTMGVTVRDWRRLWLRKTVKQITFSKMTTRTEARNFVHEMFMKSNYASFIIEGESGWHEEKLREGHVSLRTES